MRVMDLLFYSVRLGVGRLMILAAVFVMRVSLAGLDNMVTRINHINTTDPELVTLSYASLAYFTFKIKHAASYRWGL